MIERVRKIFRGIFNPKTINESDRRRLAFIALAVCFLVFSTAITALDSLFPDLRGIQSIQEGGIASNDIVAPFSHSYVSEILTARDQEAAAASILPIFDPPDPNVSRQQIQLLRQILDFVDNVRRDPYSTTSQKVSDISQITALTLDESVITSILMMENDLWRSVDTETTSVLERVMRESIRQSDLSTIIDSLPSQVTVRFDLDTANVVVALVSDLVRANRSLNSVNTELAREEAAASVRDVIRSFERGQVVIRSGTVIDEVDYEALREFNLLATNEVRGQTVIRAFLASLLILIVITFYILQKRPSVYNNLSYLGLLTAIFLGLLLGARLFATASPDQFYIYPLAALGLLAITFTSTEIAILVTASLALLVSLITNGSLELAVLGVTGGALGVLSMPRGERINSYFMAGIAVILTNITVILIFHLEGTSELMRLSELILYGVINGVLAAIVALVGMYLISFGFNLPTSLKLVELSQSNQPLLQRLLREAPGTYQHSLQVANLSEQAANAIGANAELVRVAALYHDIGKMLNPLFFVENQADGVNPHDVLHDPYRSADIIISHVTGGDRLARQNRLPARLRDFIREHHGTTLVLYFYNEALQRADDPETVDQNQFRYPGPKPQTRETAIMMLADTCESTVRARKPTSKQEISEIVTQIFDNRLQEGQLDESNITLKELDRVRTIFIEMLQAVFHPRINYPKISVPRPRTEELPPVKVENPAPTDERTSTAPSMPKVEEKMGTGETQRVTAEFPVLAIEEDDAPLPEVPRLRKSQQRVNDTSTSTPEKPEDTPPKEE